MKSAARVKQSVSTPSVRESLARLQAAVRDLMASVPNVAGSRPVDVMAALGIDLKLAWKLARIAQTGDPFAIVRHLPGSAGWRIATEAAKTAGAPQATVTRAGIAFEEAVSLGTAWAGDRKAFDIMAAGLAAGSDMRIDVEHRRQLYLGGSYVWGVRARAAVRVDILGPSQKKRTFDCATIRGFIDLERMRADTAWRLEAPFTVDDRGTKPVRAAIEPLQAGPASRGGAAAGPHILRDFSSKDLPELRPLPGTKTPRTLELADSEVGTEGRFTIFHGSVLRAVQPVKTSPRHHGIFQLSKQRTPVERTVFDLAVHRSLVNDDPSAEAILYSDLNSRQETYHHSSRDRIPAGLEVEALGSGLRRTRLADFDRYGDLLGMAFERLGWEPSEFQFFRVDAPYPPVPSTLALEMPLKD
ncbi:MAG: hypothetical protein RLZZ238_944 [Planctomycetota bacterium]